MNPGTLRREGNRIEIDAPAGADFFRSPDGSVDVASAPFWYTEAEGDFVMRVRVSVPFRDTYDSACIMVMADETIWAKACFEQTDFGTHAAVSVVNRGDSDDANGCDLTHDAIWLQVCRAGNTFAFHYSADGEDWRMMRFFGLPAGPVIRVGLVAQAPAGPGGVRVFEDLSLEFRTVENLRAGK